jgi:UDP-N-acetylmuramoylalanine--D-glutamate ligase
LIDGWATLVRNGDRERILPIAEIRIPGLHNAFNVLAAAAACMPFGVGVDAIAKAAREFPGLAHRLEHVATVDGVSYVNNSMCTNPEALAASVRAFGRPVILIAGGKNKGLDLSPVRETAPHIQAAILIGASGREVGSYLDAGGVASLSYADTMDDAVRSATAMARSGDIVLLAPGCASFDMFKDFEDRGRAFIRAVHSLDGTAKDFQR